MVIPSSRMSNQVSEGHWIIKDLLILLYSDSLTDSVNNAFASVRAK